MNTRQKVAAFKRMLKDKYPSMFSHPEAKDGEVFIGEQIIENFFYLKDLKKGGLTTARSGNITVQGPEGAILCAPKQPFFVNLQEFARVEAPKCKKLQR